MGAMTWMVRDYVAQEILNAKEHSDYPKSDRPSSEDRRMIFLGIATAAGIFELKISTALRKLSEAGLGPERISVEVHRWDKFKERMRAESFTWAESVANYFWLNSNGEWIQLRDLPCEVPKDWYGGYFVYGITDTGEQVAFATGLPLELKNITERQEDARVTVPRGSLCADLQAPLELAPNHVVCRCGATIVAKTRQLALRALAEHRRAVHKRKTR